MKFISTLYFIIISIISFGQKVSYKDLIGYSYMDSLDNVNVYWMRIEDSSNIIMVHPETPYYKLKYKLDTTNQTLIITSSRKFFYKSKNCCWKKFKYVVNSIKITNKDTLTLKWPNSDLFLNFVRINSPK